MKTNPDDLKQQILRILSGPKYRPLDNVELGKALGRKSGVRMNLNQTLKELERAGEIARIRKNRYVLPSEADLVTGTVHVHQSGFAFRLEREQTGRTGSLHRGGKHRHRDAWRSRRGANHAR